MPTQFASTIHTSFRDSALGEAIYYLSGKKILVPTYNRHDYAVPEKYLSSYSEKKSLVSTSTSANSPNDSAKGEFADSVTAATDSAEASKTYAQPAARSSDGRVLVDWDGENDPENPKNWCFFKKILVTIIVSVATTSVYMATAIYTPALEQMIGFFNTTEPKVMLGVTMFVYGYGLGPLIFSAMSENPLFGGRRLTFVFPQLIFTVLQIPTALSNHIAPFVVLRFLAGIFASPPLTITSAVLSDVWGFPALVYALMLWSLGCIAGPYIGPLIGAALTHANSWRWSIWYLLFQAGFMLFVIVILLPETNAEALLIRKAQKLRKVTGNDNIVAKGEIEADKMRGNYGAILKSVLWLPLEMTIREPVLLFINLHLALVYAVIYLCFEAFPIVYGELYHFTSVEQGCTYLGLLAGCVIACMIYLPYISLRLIKPLFRGEHPGPESVFVTVTVYASCLVPIGLFVFGWTAHESIHWIVPLIGNVIFSIGTWYLFQTYIAYLGQMYPTRMASAMASNTVFRCLIGGAFPIFGRAFYKNLGPSDFPVAWGCTILGVVGILMISLPVFMRIRGEKLREGAIKKWGDKLQR